MYRAFYFDEPFLTVFRIRIRVFCSDPDPHFKKRRCRISRSNTSIWLEGNFFNYSYNLVMIYQLKQLFFRRKKLRIWFFLTICSGSGLRIGFFLEGRIRIISLGSATLVSGLLTFNMTLIYKEEVIRNMYRKKYTKPSWILKKIVQFLTFFHTFSSNRNSYRSRNVGLKNWN